ncbi:universal stress protein [Candidatus Bathyarchaeota archaeon]|nr:universal stress protein [Candidatus Bathyarchaeota archaeon]
MIRRILVPLDGSEAAEKALDFALDLAEKYSAQVVLLSAVPPVVVPMAPRPTAGIPPIPSVAMGTYSEELKTRHEKLLSEALKKAKEIKPNLKVSKKLVEGRPSDKIIEAAKEGNFDIIVMGSRGLGGIKAFFLGSVSNRVADGAECPVLIVK